MVKKFKKYASSSLAALMAFVLLAGSAGPALAAESVIFTQTQNITLSSSNDVIQILHSGTNISVDTVVINTANIQITVDDDDVVTLVNPDRKTLNASNVTGATSSCGANDFRVTIPDQGATVTSTVTVGAVCSAGGGGGGGGAAPAPAPEPTPTPTVPTTTTGEVTATATEGGKTTITTTENVAASVELPAAAVSASTTVSIAPAAKADATASRPVPSGKSVVGSNLYNYVASSGGTAVTTFSQAVTLTFTYTDAQVAGLNINSLKVHYYDETAKIWIALSTVVDTVTKKVTATTTHFTYFGVFGDPAVSEVSLVDTAGTALVDGDLIKTDSSFDIFIVKLIGTKKFKRLILNPDIFNSYGHLKWSNVKTVSQTVMDAFTLADLVIEVNADGSVYDPKVYKISSSPNTDVGQRQWLNMTAAQFEAASYDWDAIYKINHTEAGVNFYPLGTAITS